MGGLATIPTILPAFAPQAPPWRSVTNLYFAADTPPFTDRIIALNGKEKGRIDNIAILSNIAPSYAPANQAFLFISLLGLHQEDKLPELVKRELLDWFGPPAKSYRHLRTDHLRHALPEQAPGHPSPGYLKLHDTFICGDHTTTASIEGAIISGKKTAQAILSLQLDA